ncbi:MAG: KH domain-containing protein [Anaerolineae bacterium]|nr:KH domain-containing protein [Anaerolineae bacterium]
MKDLVAYMARNLVNDPSQVRVRERNRTRSVVLELSVAPEDMGRVIGKGGRVANAMRVILRVAAMRQGKRATLNIVES